MHMSNHSAKFISALFASILAGASFAAAPESGVRTAHNCLSGPKGAIPAGHHWYYRIEYPSQRQCWYSRAETDKPETGKTARTAPQDSASSPPPQTASSSIAANPESPQQGLLARKSIADARAELTYPQMRIDQETNNGADPRTSGGFPAPSIQSSLGTIAPDTTSPSSHVASRWPESSGVISSSNNPRLAAAEPPAGAQCADLIKDRLGLFLELALQALNKSRKANLPLALELLGAKDGFHRFEGDSDVVVDYNVVIRVEMAHLISGFSHSSPNDFFG